MTRLADLRTRWQRARAKRWVRWGTDAVLILVVVLVAGAWQTRGHLDDVAMPELELASVEGGPVPLASLAGKPTMVVFWAPWCSVCAAQSQNVSWTRKLVGDHANVVSIVSAYRGLEDVREYMRAHEVEYPVLLGSDRVVESFRIEAFPTIYFLDADGRIDGSAVGYTTTLGMIARLLF